MSLRAQRWKEIIAACNTSGMKKVDWMRLHGVSEKSFYRWQNILRDQVLDGVETSYPIVPDYVAVSDKRQAGAVPELIDMTAIISQKPGGKISPAQSAVPQKQITPEIMIQAGPYNLYIGNSVTEATLATVLKVIGHA
jgi:hypothetical protein